MDYGSVLAVVWHDSGFAFHWPNPEKCRCICDCQSQKVFLKHPKHLLLNWNHLSSFMVSFSFRWESIQPRKIRYLLRKHRTGLQPGKQIAVGSQRGVDSGSFQIGYPSAGTLINAWQRRATHSSKTQKLITYWTLQKQIEASFLSKQIFPTSCSLTTKSGLSVAVSLFWFISPFGMRTVAACGINYLRRILDSWIQYLVILHCEAGRPHEQLHCELCTTSSRHLFIKLLPLCKESLYSR